MNPNKNNPFLRVSTKFIPLSLGLAVGAIAAQSAQALTWDANNTGALQTDGAGVWLGANQWWDGAANVTWTSGSDAVFGNGGGAGTMNVSLASPTTANSITFNAFLGTYTLGTAGQALTINTGITKNTGTGIATITSPITLGGDAIFTNHSTVTNTALNLSALSGAFNITKAGAGQVSLVANPLFSGATTLEQGELSLGNAGALGTSTTALALGNANSITNNYSVLALLSGTNSTTRNVTVGASNAATAGTYTLGTGNVSSSATWTGIVTLNQSLTLSAANGGNGTYTQAGTITSGAAGTQTVTITTNKTNSTATTVSAVIGGGTGTIALAKINTGTANLTGANTYTGGTTVNAGTLNVGTGGTLGATTGALAVNNLNTGAGTTVALNLAAAVDTTVGSLSGTVATPSGGTNVARITNGGSGRDFTVNQTAAGTYAGVIAGAGTFTLGSLSTNTLTLTGASTYTGATTVSAGTLYVNGSLAATAVTANGGTFGGTGTVGANVTINVANFAAGASAGSMEIAGDLALTSSSTTSIELGGTAFALNGTEEYDRTKLTGAAAALTLGSGNLSVSLINSFTLAANQAFGIFQIDAGAARTGTFSGLATDGALVGNFGGVDLFITYSGNFGDSGTVDLTGGNDIVLYTVPEPGAALLGGLGMLCLFRRRRAM